MASLEQAKTLVKLARDSIQAGFSGKKVKPSRAIVNEFSEPRGVFVTLNLDNQLRGCIGFPEPVYPLYHAVLDAAQSAAFKDPRFPALTKEEFPNVIVELSVLTLPSLIGVRNPEDYFKNIQVGKDGLIIRGTFSSGLLLPQVALEQKWDAKTFLQQTCVKAGLQPNDYTDYDNCRVYKFQSEVFAEQSPGGDIVKKL